jgi:hypothetical protein
MKPKGETLGEQWHELRGHLGGEKVEGQGDVFAVSSDETCLRLGLSENTVTLETRSPDGNIVDHPLILPGLVEVSDLRWDSKRAARYGVLTFSCVASGFVKPVEVFAGKNASYRVYSPSPESEKKS